MNALLQAPIWLYLVIIFLWKIVSLVFSTFFPFFPVSSSFFRFFSTFFHRKGKNRFFPEKTQPCGKIGKNEDKIVMQLLTIIIIVKSKKLVDLSLCLCYIIASQQPKVHGINVQFYVVIETPARHKFLKSQGSTENGCFE